MTREEFQKLAESGVILLDGATGSNLRKAGMPVGVSTELWVLEHPQAIQKLQMEYAEAGSRSFMRRPFPRTDESCNA